MCILSGYGLARVCVDSDNNIQFKEIASCLTQQKAQILLNEIIYHRIFLVDLKCFSAIHGERYETFFRSFIDTIKHYWEKENYVKVKEKIDYYSNGNVTDFFEKIMINADIKSTDFRRSDKNFMKNIFIFIANDINDLTNTINLSIKDINSNYDEWSESSKQAVDEALKIQSQNSKSKLPYAIIFIIIVTIIYFVSK